MPADQLINTRLLAELLPELLTPEALDAMGALDREVWRRFKEARAQAGDAKSSGDALRHLKLAEVELQALAHYLLEIGEDEGEEIPIGPHGEILAAYRRELATSFASYLDEISGDLRGMMNPPLPALMTWSQAHQEIGPSFRTRWPRSFVSPASVESSRQRLDVAADIAREVDELIASLDAQAKHLAAIADRLPEPSTAVQALLENDQEAAFREHPLEALKWSLKYLEGETEGLLKHFRRERAKFPLSVEAEAAEKETS